MMDGFDFDFFLLWVVWGGMGWDLGWIWGDMGDGDGYASGIAPAD